MRAKKRKDQTYYHLVESRREDGKVKQRSVAYLGKSKSLAEAIEACLKDMERQRAHQREFFETALRRPHNKMWLDHAHAADAKAKGLERRLESYIALLAKAPDALHVKAAKRP